MTKNVYFLFILLTIFSFYVFLRYTSRSGRTSGISAIAGSAINVNLDTQQRHARHSDLKLTLGYNREQIGNSWARQAAIMNHSRAPSLKLTNTLGENREINHVSDFFKELEEKKKNIDGNGKKVVPNTEMVGKLPETVQSVPKIPIMTKRVEIPSCITVPTVKPYPVMNPYLNNNCQVHFPVQNPYSGQFRNFSKPIFNPVASKYRVFYK